VNHPLLRNSHGTRPEVVQDDVFPEGIVGIDYAAESRSLLVATAAGTLTLLNRDGRQLMVSRQYEGVRSVVWSDVGNFGAAVLGNDQVVCFDGKLNARWDVRITGTIRAIAISSYGSHLAISADSSRTHIVTTDKKEIASFDTTRPLDYLQFVQDQPQIVGAAEFGHLCVHDLNGTELWYERISNNVGDLSVTGCGRRILLAAFNHGVQMMTGSGRDKGAFMVDGIPATVSVAANKRRMSVTTLESRVYWLNLEGELLWAVDLATDPPVRVITGPLGDRMFLATQSGCLLQLCW